MKDREISHSLKEQLRKILGSRVRFDVPLAKYISMGVGGPADIFVEAESENEIRELLLLCEKKEIPFLILGGGSNIIVLDGGWRGMVARFAGNDLCGIKAVGRRLTAGAGALLAELIGEAIRRSLSGLEYLAGIPGTVGGAARMNAGARDHTFGDAVTAARVMDFSGGIRQVEGREMGFSYRGCEALMGAILLSVEVELRQGGAEGIMERFRRFSAEHAARIPGGPSAGCVFKNPESGPSAGELIESAGLKGMRSGAAAVSKRHGNVIVNSGGATARDIVGLIQLVRRRVHDECGVDLEPEVMVFGEEEGQ